MDIRIAANNPINPSSFVDGPGQRATLFLQGCSIRCPGCQSQHLWPAAAGQAMPVEQVADTLMEASAQTGNITIMGGEPFDQPAALADLVGRLGGHVIVYTGYTLEQLTDPAHPAFSHLPAILKHIDILVDGPFVRSQDDPLISYRGSRNQRPIDVKASLRTGFVVELDWDSPEIVLTGDGDLLAPVGLAGELGEIGTVERTRRCGQSSNLANL